MAKISKDSTHECNFCGCSINITKDEYCQQCGEFYLDSPEEETVAHEKHLSNPIDDHGRNGILDTIEEDDDDDWERWEDPFYEDSDFR